MKITVKENRELIMVNARNTQNENEVETLQICVPEKYEDFNKKIVFITDDGVVWDLIENDTYTLQRNITKYDSVKFYIWLTKDEQDFRSIEKTLYFNKNHEVDGEVTPEEQTQMEQVISILESEIDKVENLESQVDGKLAEIDTVIDNVDTAIQETENLDLDAEKVNNTTTVTITKKDGTEKSVSILDGADLQFIWQGTSLGIKTENQQEYTFVDLQGVQGPTGPQGEPFTIKKTYSSVAEMNTDFNNMQLGDYVMIASTVEVEDNAKLYTRGASQWIFITDFSGATGIRGETGLTPNIQIGTVAQGSSFNVTRTGTNENPILNFTLVKGDKGEKGDDYTLTQQDKQDIAGLVDVPVEDVQINGTSIVNNGVANINAASTSEIKTGSSTSKFVSVGRQGSSTFYGLAKASGDTTQSQSSNAVGTYTDDAKEAIQSMLGVPSSDDVVEDVQIDGNSIVSDGVAEIPMADDTHLGAVSVNGAYGVGRFASNGALYINYPTAAYIKAGTNNYRPIVPSLQHQSTFYGLAKAAGDTTQSSSSNDVGTYTDEAKEAIRDMLGIDDAIDAKITNAIGGAY